MSLDLAALVSHPIQYQAPLFREIAARDDVELTVYFCDRRGAEAKSDPGFGNKFVWDVPLLKGYDYEFLSDWSPLQDTTLLAGILNPGIISRLRNRNPDALWVHGYASLTNWLAFLASEAFDVPLVLRGESTLLDLPPWYLRNVKYGALRVLFKLVDTFAAIGTRNSEFYESYGIEDERIFHAPYTVNNQFWRKRADCLPDQKQLRAEEYVPVDRPVALFVGKLVERKRPAVLLQAFCRATEAAEASLVFVGDGERRPALEREAKRRGRFDDIIFAGFQNQSRLPRYYKMADIFVLPSVQENWGLVVNEAMNFELPVIATDAVGSTADLVDESNGCVVPADDSSAINRAVSTILNDERLREEMGEVSRRRIEEWDVNITADGIVKAARAAVRRTQADEEAT